MDYLFCDAREKAKLDSRCKLFLVDGCLFGWDPSVTVLASLDVSSLRQCLGSIAIIVPIVVV